MTMAVGLGGAGHRGPQRGHLETWILRCTTACLLFAGVLLGLDFVLQWSNAAGDNGRTTDATPIFLEVEGVRFAVPANMLRFDRQRAGGVQDQVDIEVLFPDVSGYTAENRAAFNDVSAASRSMFITIRPRLTETDTAGRVAAIYRHYFAAAGNMNVEGLAGYRLDPGSGLGDDEVYVEAGSTRPFAAECGTTDLPEMPADCTREIHAGETLSVTVRFRRHLLDDWSEVDRATRALLASFGILS